jgi:hypothetical protein
MATAPDYVVTAGPDGFWKAGSTHLHDHDATSPVRTIFSRKSSLLSKRRTSFRVCEFRRALLRWSYVAFGLRPRRACFVPLTAKSFTSSAFTSSTT